MHASGWAAVAAIASVTGVLLTGARWLVDSRRVAWRVEFLPSGRAVVTNCGSTAAREVGVTLLWDGEPALRPGALSGSRAVVDPGDAIDVQFVVKAQAEGAIRVEWRGPLGRRHASVFHERTQ